MTAATLLLAMMTPAQWGPPPRVGVRIERRHHTPNIPQGYCLPSSVETVGRHHGMRALHGYRDRKLHERGGASGAMTLHEAASNLDRAGIRHEFRPSPAANNDHWLRGHTREGRPVIVPIRSQDDRPYDHAVAVTDIDNHGVWVYDPNPPHRRFHTRQQWAHRYHGGGLAILPNRR